MKVAEAAENLEEAFLMARREAAAAFGNDEVYMERYLSRPRHIEIQIAGDQHGNVVHFGERVCSIQRRHQKVVEEAPSPALHAAVRQRIGRRALAAIPLLAFLSFCTLAFLYFNSVFLFFYLIP